MHKIAFIAGQDAGATTLRGQIYNEVKAKLLKTTSFCDVERGTAHPENSISLSLFPSSQAEALLMYDLADRDFFRERGPEGAFLAPRHKYLLVPGRWHRRRLLADKALGLTPDRVLITGSPRVDYLRKLQADQPERPVGGKPRVLYAPMHQRWTDANDVPLSSGPQMWPLLDSLRQICDLTVEFDQRNLDSKEPITQALLDADIVITDYTSLIYEAWALGKPVIFPRWLTGDRILAKAPNCAEAQIYRDRIGHHADNMDDLRDLIAQGAALEQGEGVADFMDDYLCNWQDGDAGRRVAQVLERQADRAWVAEEPSLRGRAAAAQKAGDHDLACDLYSRILARNDFEPELFAALAQSLHIRQIYWGAAEALRNALNIDPTNGQYYQYLGAAEEAMGRNRAAAAAYGEAIARTAKPTLDQYYTLGYVLETPGTDGEPDFSAAAAAYAKAVAMAPTSKVVTQRKASDYGVGVLHTVAGRWKEAQPEFRKLLKSMPLDAELRFRLGRTHDRCYEWAEAEEHFRLAIALGAGDGKAEWHFRLGFVLERQEKYAEAAIAYTHALELNKKPSKDYIYRTAYALEKAGRLEEACQTFLLLSKAPDELMQAPEDPYLEGFKDIYATHMRQVLKERPRDLALWDQYSTHMEAQGDLTEAIAAYEKVILLSPGYTTTLGRRLDKLKEQLRAPKREREILEKRLDHDCLDPNQWLTYSKVVEAQDDLDSAVMAMRQVVMRENAHKPAHYYRLGMLLYRQGKLDEACESFRDWSILQRPHGTYERRFTTNDALREVATYREFYDMLPIMKNSVMYESFGGEGLSDNPLALFQQIRRDPRFEGWTHIWTIDSLDKVPADLRGARDVFFVDKGSVLYQRYLCTAEYLINNATFPSYYVRKDGQKYLNTWHGTPLKTLGYDIEATPLQRANTARNLIQASMFIAPNKHTEHVMLGRYGVQNLFTGTSLISGYPRIDQLVNATEDDKQQIIEQLGIDPSKPIVLFAPTYRGHWATPELEAQDLVRTIERMKSPDYNLLFRGHYFAEKAILEMDLPVTIAPHSIDSCKLLSIVDVLISDYSSIFYDFLLTERPVIHYIYDWDYYVETRGVYFGKEALPGLICEDEDSLIQAVHDCVRDPKAQIHPRYLDAKERYSQMEDGRAGERVIQALFFDEDGSPKHQKFPKGKSHLLYHIGHMDPDSTTSAAQALLKATHDEGHINTVLVDRRMIIDNEDRTRVAQQMLDRTDVIIRFGRTCFSLEEAWINDKYNSLKGFPSPQMEDAFSKAMKHEVRRLVGHAQFDAAIEMAGTRPFWAHVMANTDAKTHLLRTNADLLEERDRKFPDYARLIDMVGKFDTILSPTESLTNKYQANLSRMAGATADQFKTAPVMIEPEKVTSLAAETPEDADFDRFLADPNLKLVSTENLWPERDYDSLLEALKMLNSFLDDADAVEGAQVNLYMLGDGPARLDLERMVGRIGVQANVRLLGWKPNPYAYLANANAAIFSSRHTTPGTALLEALTLKTPVIATEMDGLQDVLSGKQGVIAENTAEGLADAIAQVLDGSFKPAKFDAVKYNAKAYTAFMKATRA